MSNDIETVSVAEAPPPEVPTDPAGRRLRWLELSLVLAVCFAPAIITSLDILINGRGALPSSTNLRLTASIVHEVSGLLLVGYILWRRKIQIADLGLRWSFRDLCMGLVVAIVAYLAYAVGPYLIHLADHTMYASAQRSNVARQMFGQALIAMIPYSLLNPFYEELVVRAYLMTEVKALTGSWTLAAALSVIVQFSYHLYYGWEGAIALSFLFLVFSIYYAWTKKATPIIVAHEIFDIWGLVRIF